MKKLSESFNEITIARGEKFVIELDENPSTGHRWHFQIVSGKAAKLNDQFQREGSQLSVGTVGKRRMTFRAYGRKDIVIDAKYKRGWEKDAAGELKLKVKII